MAATINHYQVAPARIPNHNQRSKNTAAPAGSCGPHPCLYPGVHFRLPPGHAREVNLAHGSKCWSAPGPFSAPLCQCPTCLPASVFSDMVCFLLAQLIKISQMALVCIVPNFLWLINTTPNMIRHYVKMCQTRWFFVDGSIFIMSWNKNKAI